MAWYTIPGLLVAILAIIQLLLDEKTSDIEGVKRDILLNLIRSVVISIPIFLVEIIILYICYKDLDFRYFYNDIVLKYSSYLYLFIFIDVFLLLWFLPYFSSDTTKVEKYGSQYLIQSKSTSKNINVGVMYFVEKFRNVIGLKISTFLYRLLLFSSLLIWIIVVVNVVHNSRLKDLKYPFVANEKIFIKNIKPIDIYEVNANKEIKKGSLPKDTVFSIAKGTNFSFDYEKLNKNERGGKSNIYNGVYGLSSSKKISIRKGSKLYFEEMLDYTIYVNDKSKNLSGYYTVKTIPGKTYIQSNSNMNYEVIANPERNVKDTYSFIVGYTKENIDYNKFLDNAMLLNGISMMVLLIAIPFILQKYRYLSFLIFISIIPLSIIVTNRISWRSGILGILLVIILIEMINYMFFLRRHIFIKRLESTSEVSIEVLNPKSEFIFTHNNKNIIDLKLTDDNWDDKTKYKYTVSKNNGKKLEGELRIIAYKSVWNILWKYFSNYHWIIKIINALFNKDKSND